MKGGKLHVAAVLGSLRIGGAERAMVNLVNGLAEKNVVADIVVVEKEGEFISQLYHVVNIVDLGKKRARNGIFTFRKYLLTNSPDVLIVVQIHVQLMVFFALAFSKWNGILILNEQSTYTSNVRNKIFRILSSFLFSRADVITVVSKGASVDLAEKFPFLKRKIRVIPNPVFSADNLLWKEERITHPFLNDKKYPVILSAGRLTASKNFNSLLNAFALLMKSAELRLIILGEGEERASIEKHAKELGISEFISLPGNVRNPYSFMNRCDVFVLSSIYEGLPSVLIEALACGCKIVSTDCPHGPAEILENGKFGKLVPVNDAEKLSEAILQILSEENNKAEKINHAEKYSIEKITSEYLGLIERIANER